MKKETENLMKHFASVLRGRALGQVKPEINTTIVRFLSRKELIAIVKKRFNGSVPKEHDLMELENEELVELIGDEMYVIAYMTDRWCGDLSKVNTSKSTTPVKKEHIKTHNTKK